MLSAEQVDARGSARVPTARRAPRAAARRGCRRRRADVNCSTTVTSLSSPTSMTRRGNTRCARLASCRRRGATTTIGSDDGDAARDAGSHVVSANAVFSRWNTSTAASSSRSWSVGVDGDRRRAHPSPWSSRRPGANAAEVELADAAVPPDLVVGRRAAASRRHARAAASRSARRRACEGAHGVGE